MIDTLSLKSIGGAFLFIIKKFSSALIPLTSTMVYNEIFFYQINHKYSRVPNNRPPRLLIFEKFSNPPALIPTPPFINFWKNEMILDIISE